MTVFSLVGTTHTPCALVLTIQVGSEFLEF